MNAQNPVFTPGPTNTPDRLRKTCAGAGQGLPRAVAGRVSGTGPLGPRVAATQVRREAE